tara:strand:- start:127 stop:357 length:231 start_codon:yes stop_codon:yes gene_type:complete
MKNYRELTQQESKEIKDISCEREHNDVFSKYYLDVFTIRFNNEYSGEKSFRYYIADRISDLIEGLNISKGLIKKIS